MTLEELVALLKATNHVDVYIKVNSYEEIVFIRKSFTLNSFWEHINSDYKYPLYISIGYDGFAFSEGWTANTGNWLYRKDLPQFVLNFNEIISGLGYECYKIKEEIGI